MRKFLSTAFVMLIVACLLSLAGCSALSSLEKDINVVYKTDGEYVGSATVNQFNNAVLPEEKRAGFKFFGWTVKEDWTYGVDSESLLIPNTGLVRYDDVKGYVEKGSNTVVLHSVYVDKALLSDYDIIIAWYGKSATSGIQQSDMDAFKANLDIYLATQGFEQPKVLIRGYGTRAEDPTEATDVGGTCAAIMKDDDVDIMVGWSSTSNLTSTGGMKEGIDFIENVGSVKIGSSNRYAARLSDSDTCRLVYIWIQNTYGAGAADTPVTPDTPEEPEEPETPPTPTDKVTVTDTVLNVSIWNNSKGAWITADQIEKLKTDFAVYVEENVTNHAEVTVNWIVEPDVTDVATLAASVTAAGNIDFVVACGPNVDTNEKGHLDNLVKTLVAASDYMAASRYVAVLHADAPNQLAVVLYEFMTGSGFTVNAA